MGADGLYFDILNTSVQDLSQLTWSPVEYDGIKVTAHWTRPDQRDNWIKDKGQFVVRVWLNGPNSREYSNPNPGGIHKPNLPHTFVLEGKDASGRVMVKYGFELRQWFVNRGRQHANFFDQKKWCESLGYRLPLVKELTNAFARSRTDTMAGATPNSSGNNYHRRIGGGFFSEWGNMKDYVDADFTYRSWTSEVVKSNSQFPYSVSIDTGHIGSNQDRTFFTNVDCTTP
ncbi:hypothetical protein A9G27_06350 [Gilliamella sp. Bim3-2]|nr:hypothetical protein A9G32_00010 [Gilliamella apicola]OCG46639.1 hypothetical protein A9G27_06350 [Gilliamella apicola]